MQDSSTSNSDPIRPVCMDGNEAAADVAYRLNELCAIYPITPSSPMGELADARAHRGEPNLFGSVPKVVEMQSEAGAAGTLHGALQTGALATTFTSSQGLLLMLPNFYKIAGELSPCVVHVASRALATQALSIFGDHSDVMAARGTGFAMLFAANVQEAHDFALIAQAASLKSRLPFFHVFDGFRTSHELRPVQRLADSDLAALVDEDDIRAHRERALNPNRPVLRGTSQNPDVFFQARESINRFYDALPDIFASGLHRFAEQTGRRYAPVEFYGPPDAEHILVLMGSATETAVETARHLQDQGQKTGVIQIRLYRPWPEKAFLDALPASAKTLAVLDRTKEPGGFGEPLFLDVAATLQANRPGIHLSGGRYGLGSKEFTPAMVRGIFDHLQSPQPRPRFTVGIHDDLTLLSLPVPAGFHLEDPDATRAIFHGLGADGTVSAIRNTLHILAESTDLHTQAYFVFDSNKAGSRTVSHLRMGPAPIRKPYLIQSANFIACHQFAFFKTLDILESAAPGVTVLLNAPHPPETLYEHLPREVTETLRRLQAKVFVINAAQVARDCGLGGRINTVMQACFFAIQKPLPETEARDAIRAHIRQSYGAKGEMLVTRNLVAVDTAPKHLHAAPLPPETPALAPARPATVPLDAYAFVREITAKLIAGKGDELPVSALPPDGTWPTGTAAYNRRDLSPVVPQWDADLCIQCGHCVLVCPHGVIQAKQSNAANLTQAPPGFPSAPLRGHSGEPPLHYLLQISLPDCTGCGLCVEICPAKSKTNPKHKSLDLVEKAPIFEKGAADMAFFKRVPDDRVEINNATVRGVQFLPATFEFPGACAGCGETPYLKLVSQLFGDRMLVANATGCSSIYGGNLPVTPWTTDNQGRGPAWSNSLFEDNAEFGLGFRLGVNSLTDRARQLLQDLAPDLSHPECIPLLLGTPPETPREFSERRAALAQLQDLLSSRPTTPALRELQTLADHLIPRSVWIVGGDGWAYDIGFGGLEHVLCGGENVNILVLDTEVYSNTGGQASKATPLGAAAKFAAGGKPTAKNDLALSTILKGNVYVAAIALGAKLPQALRAIREAEAYPGPSLLHAYSPCIAHGYSMRHSLDQMDKAVKTGYWPLFRFDPRLRGSDKPALQLDSPAPTLPLKDFTREELRFRLSEHAAPTLSDARNARAQAEIHARHARLQALAATL